MMSPTVRPYNHPGDFTRVGNFLVRTFHASHTHVNWMQARWEYMHFHPYIHKINVQSIGVWEREHEIVAVAHPEHDMGVAYFQMAPGYECLQREMLDWAEAHIAEEKAGTHSLCVYLNDHDITMRDIVVDRGYDTQWSETMSRCDIPESCPPISLPPGFRLISLADENNHRQIRRVLWRGFNHGEEPPDDGDGNPLAQGAPSFRKDLTIAVVSPEGNFVSYCGMWFDAINAVAYIEPVATDPDYRRQGLGRAAVLEGMKRCGTLGATAAYVGTDKPFYLALGFTPVYRDTVWRKVWS